MACSASDNGSVPNHQDAVAASTTSPNAASNAAAGPRPRASRGAITATSDPHSATATHWFSSVADGGW